MQASKQDIDTSLKGDSSKRGQADLSDDRQSTSLGNSSTREREQADLSVKSDQQSTNLNTEQDLSTKVVADQSLSDVFVDNSEPQATEKSDSSSLEISSDQRLQSNETSSNSTLISTSISLEHVKQAPPPPPEKRQSVDEEQSLSEDPQSSQHVAVTNDGDDSTTGKKSHTEEDGNGNHM